MSRTALKLQAFRAVVSRIKESDSLHEEAFFRLIEELRAEDVTPMTARRLMLDAGLRRQRVNEAFRIARMGAVEYRHWKLRFIGFQAAISTINQNAS